MSDEPIVVLYDTLSARKKSLELLEAGHCKLYVCGPTVYDLSHLGHARAFVAPDVLVRFLRSQGLHVKYVRNITDIDDKIIRRAQEEHSEPLALAERYITAFHEDFERLGCIPPDLEPRATEHVPHMLELIGRLLAKGLAYASDGDVYFPVDAFPDYGKLSKRNLEELRAGARVEISERKRNPLDFVLWKAAKPGEPAWDSPWGRGRPGWHIECSAMSETYLSCTFDLHGGGHDLVFPHHENELAQSQGANGAGTFARHWIHNGFVNFAGEKMSKSLGNFFTIREITTLYLPEVLRYFLLSVHYRSTVNFDVEVSCPSCNATLPSEAQQSGACPTCSAVFTMEQIRARLRFPGLEEADDRVAYVYETIARATEALGTAKDHEVEDSTGAIKRSVADMLPRFWAALRDDLNTAAALAALSDALHEVNRLLGSIKGGERRSQNASLRRFVADIGQVSDVLGLFGQPPRVFLAHRRDLEAKRIGLDVERVEALVRERELARVHKNWTLADRLRAELQSLGVSVQDEAARSVWTL